MASKELNVKLKQRYDTASNWTTNNPVLLAGELGIESDTKKMKVGDGTTSWASLEYMVAESGISSEDLNLKMDKNNPTGSGSFSLNRKQDTEIGYNSTAEGTNCTSSSDSSHAEGFATKATGYASHAEGSYSEANGYSSHAECGGVANGHGSHASGTYCESNGEYSYSQGFNCQSYNDYSRATGYRTFATGKSQFVFGELNENDNTVYLGKRGKYVEIVGNGESDNARSNARTLDWDGNQWLAGTLQASGLTDGTTTKTMTEILEGGGGSKIIWREWK
jgi:hypothetical protein